MVFLNLTDSEFKVLQAIPDKIDELTVLQAMDAHGIKMANNGASAKRERERMVGNGGTKRLIEVCVSKKVYSKLVEVSFSSGSLALQQIVRGIFSGIIIPVRIKPCAFSTSLVKSAPKGSNMGISMRDLSPSKNVLVTAIDDAGNDLATPAPQNVNADSSGEAYVSMLIPAGYTTGEKISFRIHQAEVVLSDEFGEGKPAEAIPDDNKEIHVVTVTA